MITYSRGMGQGDENALIEDAVRHSEFMTLPKHKSKVSESDLSFYTLHSEGHQSIFFDYRLQHTQFFFRLTLQNF